jgi:hypothetical protein
MCKQKCNVIQGAIPQEGTGLTHSKHDYIIITIFEKMVEILAKMGS